MWIELRSIVEKVSASDMKVIVLSSTTDKYFTAGLDCEPVLPSHLLTFSPSHHLSS